MGEAQQSKATSGDADALKRRLQWRIHLANTISPKTGAPYPSDAAPPRWEETTYLPEGWTVIVDELDRKIAELAPNYHLDQAKEKFGGLRYYVANIPKGVVAEVNELIRGAEAASFHACQECGESCEGAQKVDQFLVATLCPEHLDELRRERARRR